MVGDEVGLIIGPTPRPSLRYATRFSDLRCAVMTRAFESANSPVP